MSLSVKPVPLKKDNKRKTYSTVGLALVEARKVAPPEASLQLKTLEDQLLVCLPDGRHLVRGGTRLDVGEFKPSQFNKADGTEWKLDWYGQSLPADFGYHVWGSLSELIAADKKKNAELKDYNMYGENEPVPDVMTQSALPQDKRYNAQYQFYQALLAARRNNWNIDVLVRDEFDDMRWGSYVSSGKNGAPRDVFVTLEKLRVYVTMQGETPIQDLEVS